MATPKYKLWLRVSVILQLVTSGMHSLSLINEPIPANDEEKQLIGLMKSVKLDLGAGFTPSMSDLMTSFSISLTLLLLFGGLLNWIMLSKKADITILKPIINLQLVIFGLCFTAIWYFTFIIPIICTGLIFVALILTRLSIIQSSN